MRGMVCKEGWRCGIFMNKKDLDGKGAWDQIIESLLYQDMIQVCKARPLHTVLLAAEDDIKIEVISLK